MLSVSVLNSPVDDCPPDRSTALFITSCDALNAVHSTLSMRYVDGLLTAQDGDMRTSCRCLGGDPLLSVAVTVIDVTPSFAEFAAFAAATTLAASPFDFVPVASTSKTGSKPPAEVEGLGIVPGRAAATARRDEDWTGEPAEDTPAHLNRRVPPISRRGQCRFGTLSLGRVGPENVCTRDVQAYCGLPEHDLELVWEAETPRDGPPCLGPTARGCGDGGGCSAGSSAGVSCGGHDGGGVGECLCSGYGGCARGLSCHACGAGGFCGEHDGGGIGDCLCIGYGGCARGLGCRVGGPCHVGKTVPAKVAWLDCRVVGYKCCCQA